MPRLLRLTNVVMAVELITSMTGQEEPVDDVFLNFSKAFDSMCHDITPKNPKGSKKNDEASLMKRVT